ncbi:hypothetical protein [Noviherbaspirillum sp.]|uniref:hypothetical protein n=1 Tax=Noviherbaspirillum sp. TaxID=1926288 RepID=UPI002D56E537|nr:hypothetical protein [Noviherbaspirillum sp.]HZW20885.1 hypothetical protein [Noviherbaspirillum sp.]
MKRLIFITAAFLSQAAFAEGSFTVKTGVDYTTGTYGTDTTTEITAIPLIGTYETGNWTFKASIPYVRITGSDNVVAGVGAVRRTTTTVRTDSGLGDLVTSATYSFMIDPKSQFGIDVTGKVKWGTADSDRGLGTGENDFWVLIDPYTRIGNVTWFGGIGFGMLGSSATLPLKDVYSANAGLSFKLDQQSSAGAMLDYRSRSTDTGFAQRELTGFYTRTLGGGYKLQAYATKGFADGSPDWGGGLNIAYSY